MRSQQRQGEDPPCDAVAQRRERSRIALPMKVILENTPVEAANNSSSWRHSHIV